MRTFIGLCLMAGTLCIGVSILALFWNAPLASGVPEFFRYVFLSGMSITLVAVVAFMACAFWPKHP